MVVLAKVLTHQMSLASNHHTGLLHAYVALIARTNIIVGVRKNRKDT